MESTHFGRLTRLTRRTFQSDIIRYAAGIGVIQLLFFVFWIGDKEMTPENFYFQPFLIKAFVVINLPAILVAGVTFALFFEISWKAQDWVLSACYIFLFCCYLAQWSGYGLIASLFQREKTKLP